MGRWSPAVFEPPLGGVIGGQRRAPLPQNTSLQLGDALKK